MEKLTTFLDTLSLEDIERLIDEHENGTLKKRLHEKFEENSYARKTCPVCHSPVEEGTLTLTFGPKGFRRKATFCAYDCLLYFANNVNSKEEKKEQEINEP